ncbi:MAG: UvrD-helicase domain-containing protein [Mycoplasma sp.]|nr:UvrD-helicase domain-containing protein [Mycoplasma sp.]
MEKILEGLNKSQKEAVLNTKGPLRILAGAGSGKTRVLTRKIAYLIEHEKIEPSQILAVTFTNKAAQEMKQRVKDIIGKKADDSILATYHSFCVRVLRQDINALGKVRNFNIIDNSDQRQILRPIYKKYGVSSKTITSSQMIEYISRQKSNLIKPSILIEEAETDGEKFKAKIYRDYLEVTERTNSLDFDDLLIKVYELFKNHPDVQKKWSEKFKYILIDEFQDTSWIQYEIIKRLSLHNNFTIVGDPDQTIYTWRGAKVQLILNFDKDFSNSKTIKLEENYRSTKNILNAANNLIKNNNSRIEKKLISNKTIGLPLEFHHAYSPELEAKWVAQKIINLQKSKIQLKNIAIFYRSNYLSRTIEQALILANLPYKIYGDVRFYERKEIKDALAFLKVINNGDEVSLQRIINVPARKIGSTTLSKLNDFALEKKETLANAIIKYYKVLPVSLSQKNSLGTLFNLIIKYRKAIETNSISIVINQFLIEVSYIAGLVQAKEQQKLENIKEFISTVKIWEKNNPEKTIDDYLQEVTLLTNQDNMDKFQTSVTLMTIHASKGLEFDNVFIIGMSEQVFPNSRAIMSGEKEIEEERRLAYVAVTRARERLFLSDSKGYSIDHRFMKRPSRFIAEMGIDMKRFAKELLIEGVFEKNYNKENDIILEVNDKVQHSIFGKGIIKNIEGEMAVILFEKPHGEKLLMKQHKSLKKV